MKKYSVLFLSLLVIISCSKKTIPAKTNNATIIYENTDSNKVVINTDSTMLKKDSAAAVTNTAATFLVVSNGYGKIINGQQSLPSDANVHFDAFQLSKGFNAQQLTNLKTRYNTIPPRVLYVNSANQLHSARGFYFILAKKFWYWKKNDGLFYLDEKYYL